MNAVLVHKKYHIIILLERIKMQIKFSTFFQEGKSSLTLGFTGNSSDVRQLGRFYKRLYSYAPQYEGHAAARRNIKV